MSDEQACGEGREADTAGGDNHRPFCPLCDSHALLVPFPMRLPPKQFDVASGIPSPFRYGAEHDV